MHKGILRVHYRSWCTISLCAENVNVSPQQAGLHLRNIILWWNNFRLRIYNESLTLHFSQVCQNLKNTLKVVNIAYWKILNMIFKFQVAQINNKIYGTVYLLSLSMCWVQSTYIINISSLKQYTVGQPKEVYTLRTCIYCIV